MTPKAQIIKAKIDKWNYTKLKPCRAKERIKGSKDSLQSQRKYLQTTYLKNSFCIFLSKIYKKFSTTQKQTNKTWFKNEHRTWIYISPKKTNTRPACIQKGTKPLIIREMRIKSTLRYHPQPVRMTIVKNKTKCNKFS